jgi:GDP-mannose pyrophosphatase NudK
MSVIEITNRQTLYNQKFQLEEISYKKPDNDGQLIDMKAEVYHRPDAAAILLYNKQQQTFLLTRQFRMPTYVNGNDSGYLLEACAGLIDEGETPEQAVIREAQEETGVKLQAVTHVGAVYTSAGGITEYLHLFVAPYTAGQQPLSYGGKLDEGEAIELMELSFEDARRMLKEKEIQDAKTVMLLQYYFLFC